MSTMLGRIDLYDDFMLEVEQIFKKFNEKQGKENDK